MSLDIRIEDHDLESMGATVDTAPPAPSASTPYWDSDRHRMLFRVWAGVGVRHSFKAASSHYWWQCDWGGSINTTNATQTGTLMRVFSKTSGVAAVRLFPIGGGINNQARWQYNSNGGVGTAATWTNFPFDTWVGTSTANGQKRFSFRIKHATDGTGYIIVYLNGTEIDRVEGAGLNALFTAMPTANAAEAWGNGSDSGRYGHTTNFIFADGTDDPRAGKYGTLELTAVGTENTLTEGTVTDIIEIAHNVATAMYGSAGQRLSATLEDFPASVTGRVRQLQLAVAAAQGATGGPTQIEGSVRVGGVYYDSAPVALPMSVLEPTHIIYEENPAVPGEDWKAATVSGAEVGFELVA